MRQTLVAMTRCPAVQAVLSASPTRTTAAFGDFVRALLVTPEEEAWGRSRADFLEKVIRGLKPIEQDLPGPVETVVQFGSSVRGTAFRPLTEIDLAVVFKVPYVPLAMVGYDPDALVDLLGRRLSVHARQTEAWSGEVVTLSFDELPCVDVFPAFIDDSPKGRPTMAFPRAGTAWFRTNPVALDRLFLARNAEVEGRLIPTAAILKAWSNAHGGLFPSWVLDTLLLYRAGELTGRHSVDLFLFLEAMAHNLSDVADVASADGFIVSLLTQLPPQARDEIASVASSQLVLAQQALTDEYSGADSTAIEKWRVVLGPSFAAAPPDHTSQGIVMRPKAPVEAFVQELIGAKHTSAKLGDRAPLLAETIGLRHAWEQLSQIERDQLVTDSTRPDS